MRIFDTNLIIYSYQPDYDFLKTKLITPEIYVSAISKLETLGFHKITDLEKGYFNDLFNGVNVISVENEIILEAIKLRQKRKMSVGDAIIAASALINNFTLYTHNVKDFDWIDGLKIIDPLE